MLYAIHAINKASYAFTCTKRLSNYLTFHDELLTRSSEGCLAYVRSTRPLQKIVLLLNYGEAICLRSKRLRSLERVLVILNIRSCRAVWFPNSGLDVFNLMTIVC